MAISATLVLLVGIWGLTDLAVSLVEWREECLGWAWVALGWVAWVLVAVWVALLAGLEAA